MRSMLVVAFTLAMLWPTGRSRAQETWVAVLPTLGGHLEIPDEIRQRALQAAREYLRTEDLSVMTEAAVDERLLGDDRACTPSAECVTTVRALLGVDIVVGLVIWGSSEARSEPQTVHVDLFDGEARYAGQARVVRGVDTAVRDALRMALQMLRAGPGPYLLVEGTYGATVELDGAAVGSIPLTVRAAPGEHELRVAKDGLAPQVLTVTVGDDPGRTTRVTVALQPEGPTEADAPRGVRRAAWAIPTGVVALAGGLAAAIVVPVVSAGQHGCASRFDLPGVMDQPCMTSRSFAVGPNVAWVVTGAVLAGVGIGLIAFGASDGGDGGADEGGEAAARLGVGLGHVFVEGAF